MSQRHMPYDYYRGSSRLAALGLCLMLLTTHLAYAISTNLLPGIQESPAPSQSPAKDAGSRPLDAATPVERDLSGGESHSYSLMLSKGQYFHAVVYQQGIDLVVTMSGPDGKRLVRVDRPNGMCGPEAISLIAEGSGSYQLEVRSLERTAARGHYKIKMDALRVSTPLDERRISAENAISEGELLRARGTARTFEQAIEKFQQALTIWQSLDERYEESVALYGIGWSYSAIGEYQKAVNHFNQAYSLTQEVKDHYWDAIVLTGLAWAYMYLGDIESAATNFSQALQLHRSLDNARGQAVTLHGIGWIHALRGEDQEALDSFSQSLLLRKAVKDLRGEALTLVGIGKIYHRLGKSVEALAYLNQALHLLRNLGDQYGEADTLSNIGWVYTLMRKNESALDCFNQALPLRRAAGDKAGEATTLYGIAQALRQQGRLAEAIEQIDEAIRLIESLRTKGASQQLRISYFASVQEYYEFYIDLLMQMHQLNPSENYASRALQISERSRDRGLLDLLTEANADIRQGVDPALLERERALQQQLNAAADQQRQLLSNRHFNEQAEAAASGIASLTRQFQQLEAQIREASPRYAALTQPSPLSTAEIQKQVLDEDTLLLEYALGEKRSFLWAVTPAEVSCYELPNRAEIESAVRHLYELATVRNQQAEGETAEQKRARIVQADKQYWEAATTLSQMLLRPVAAQLGTKRLLVVTQGVLQLIPFGVLPTPTAINNDRDLQTPLIATHEIVSVPSASTLALLRRDFASRRPASKTLAVLADPVFSKDDERLEINRRETSWQKISSRKLAVIPRAKGASGDFDGGVGTSSSLPRLFLSRWEAKEIATLLPAGESMLALDFAASHATATSPGLAQYRIIHFATHAVIDNLHPELSGIVLSLVDEHGQPQDGFLRVHELFNLKLPAELIVLSACKTGLGKNVQGEGLMATSRGFMYAGALRVVVSLWAVNDKATSELMVRFYKKMLGPERMRPAAALRMAQIEMSRDKRWQSPYFWGGFILQGEWR